MPPSTKAQTNEELGSYLNGLNETQLQAVKSLDGPFLILAGAGTGKTRTLTTRLAHILLKGKARPWEILAVTFTNKAAREMKGRVANLIEQSVEGWWVGAEACSLGVCKAVQKLFSVADSFCTPPHPIPQDSGNYPTPPIPHPPQSPGALGWVG